MYGNCIQALAGANLPAKESAILQMDRCAHRFSLKSIGLLFPLGATALLLKQEKTRQGNGTADHVLPWATQYLLSVYMSHTFNN